MRSAALLGAIDAQVSDITAESEGNNRRSGARPSRGRLGAKLCDSRSVRPTPLTLGVIALVCASLGIAEDVAFASVGPVTVRSVASISVPVTNGAVESIGANRIEVSSCDKSGASAALVDPATLRLHAGTCGQFPLGESVTSTTSVLSSMQSYWDCRPESAGVRSVTKLASGRILEGPVVMRYAGDCSTTRPISAYAAGSLWIYDCATGPSGDGGQIAQLSATTGAVEVSISMPSDCHTSFGADADGAFVASYDNPGPIYFVANGAHDAVVALRTAGRLNWFSANGDTTYANVGPAGSRDCAPSACGVWRFTGLRGTATILSNTDQADSLVATPTVGDGGLFSLVLLSSTVVAYEVVWIDSESGHWFDLRRLSVGGYYGGPPSLAFAAGALFVYDESTLYRFVVS
jgi:hypothetical protein